MPARNTLYTLYKDIPPPNKAQSGSSAEINLDHLFT